MSPRRSKAAAGTITDEQIRELLTEADIALAAAMRREPVDTDGVTEWGPIVAACEKALGRRRSKRRGGKRDARARCAEILNARKAGEK